MPDSDKEWEKFGKTAPYFGVLTDEKFKAANLEKAALDDFFESGQRHIEFVMREIRHIAPDVSIRKALDFGCGVGRLAFPLAKFCESVTGADISISMLEEAEKNRRRFGIDNIGWVSDIHALKTSGKRFDLVHSHIVFQHIPRNKGLALTRILTDLLDSGGMGVLHFPFRCRSLLRSLFSLIMKHVPFAYNLWNLCKKRPWSYPYMQMNVYDLNAIFRILEECGCEFCFCRFVRDGDYEGVILFFRKARKEKI
jgi:ubiquinone/menaquinone biosynthesis C-methylase UbiE